MEPGKPRQNTLTSKNSGRLRKTRSHVELNTLQRTWSMDNFPCEADQYELEKEIGKGACGTVWLAKCTPLDQEVALKIVEVDNLKVPLDVIMRETQIMAEMRHPNVMPLYCCFVHKEQLWMVMPYVAGGSLYAIMQANFPQGLEEEIVATAAQDVLRGLEYMHSHSMIHRDVKAANVLVNMDGRVVLSDFGVTANLLEPREARQREKRPTLTLQDIASVDSLDKLAAAEDAQCCSSGSSPAAAGLTDAASSIGTPTSEACGSFQSTWACQKYLARNTFTGTPCFMAPEVMAASDDVQGSGYNMAADVWSFGIFLEELALGRAPYAHMRLESVILTTLHDDAPVLGNQYSKRKFSEELHDIVAQCLQKEPSSRPTCSQLLKHKFFKKAEDSSYLAKCLLNGSIGTPSFGDMLRSVQRTLRSKSNISPKTSSQKTMNVYATATLSGDVANALALLKRMTRPALRKQKQGLLIPAKELASCQALAFTIMRKSKGVYGAHFVRGNGFVVARAQKGRASSKSFLHWAEDNFRPGLSVLDAGLPRKDSDEDKMASKDLWSAPSYFDISLVGLGNEFSHDEAEVIILLPDQAAVDIFKRGEGVLENARAHDSASSVTDGHHPAQLKAYGIDDDVVFIMPLTGARVAVNPGANSRVFGGKEVLPADILSGSVSPPHEFQVLYKLLISLEADPEPEPGSEPVRSKPGAGALCRLEERGSTMLYRMPIWLYDDDDE